MFEILNQFHMLITIYNYFTRTTTDCKWTANIWIPSNSNKTTSSIHPSIQQFIHKHHNHCHMPIKVYEYFVWFVCLFVCLKYICLSVIICLTVSFSYYFIIGFPTLLFNYIYFFCLYNKITFVIIILDFVKKNIQSMIN